MKVTWNNIFGKVAFQGLSGIQFLKVSDMSYLDTVVESLTNKIQSFQRFKIFQHFPVFVLNYTTNLKKTEKLGNLGNLISVAN